MYATLHPLPQPWVGVRNSRGSVLVFILPADYFCLQQLCLRNNVYLNCQFSTNNWNLKYLQKWISHVGRKGDNGLKALQIRREETTTSARNRRSRLSRVTALLGRKKKKLSEIREDQTIVMKVVSISHGLLGDRDLRGRALIKITDWLWSFPLDLIEVKPSHIIDLKDDPSNNLNL